MSKVLVAGASPLPFEASDVSPAPGVRTWQFCQGLASAGHTVSCLVVRLPWGSAEEQTPDRETVDGVDIRRLSSRHFFDVRTIRRLVEKEKPDVLVGATLLGSVVWARLDSELPFWADQFGQSMAEAQAKAGIAADESIVAQTWSLVLAVMRSADKISAVSESQRKALIGELGAIGRLTGLTCGFEFIEVVPSAIPSISQAPDELKMLRGTVLPREAFIVLWSGSFNVWSDIETLFAGLEKAMREEDRIHFISTGGSVPGHDQRTYAKFLELIQESEYRSRFHPQGWVPSPRVVEITRQADLGIIAEREIYEGTLGSKTRLLGWIEAGLPVLCNQVSELAWSLAQEKLVSTFECGDAEELASRILECARNPADSRNMADRARSIVRETYSLPATTGPLIEWVSKPVRAPDAGMTRRLRTPLDHGSAIERVSETVRRWPVLGRSQVLRALRSRIGR